MSVLKAVGWADQREAHYSVLETVGCMDAERKALEPFRRRIASTAGLGALRSASMHPTKARRYNNPR